MLKLYKNREERQPEAFIKIKLVDGCLQLNLVDAEGRQGVGGFLLEITEDGKLLRHYSVNKATAKLAGITLDADNRIALR